MSQLLFIVLNDTKHLPEILEVWREIGVPGTTILKSAGGHATRNWLSSVGLGAIGNIFESAEIETRTLMAVFEDDDLLNQAIAEAERITGGFERPNSGVVVVFQCAGWCRGCSGPASRFINWVCRIWRHPKVSQRRDCPTRGTRFAGCPDGV